MGVETKGYDFETDMARTGLAKEGKEKMEKWDRFSEGKRAEAAKRQDEWTDKQTKAEKIDEKVQEKLGTKE